MKFIFSRISLGVLIILIGVYILLQYVFYIHIPTLAYTPIFTIIVAVLVILWGIALLFGRGFYSSRVIVGLLVICFGLYILLQYVFNIYIPFIIYTPIFRIIVGVIIIALGIYVIFGRHYVGHDISGKLPTRMNYNVAFGCKTIDLSYLNGENNRVKVNSIFADTVIMIKDSSKVHIKASSAFGSVSVPSGDSLSFGDMNITIGESKSNILYLDIGAAFGQTRVLYK